MEGGNFFQFGNILSMINLISFELLAYRACGLSCVRLFGTPWTVSHQAPLSMEFFQARILERVAFSYSSGSSQPRDQAHISFVCCTGQQILCRWATGEAPGFSTADFSLSSSGALIHSILSTNQWSSLLVNILYGCLNRNKNKSDCNQ